MRRFRVGLAGPLTDVYLLVLYQVVGVLGGEATLVAGVFLLARVPVHVLFQRRAQREGRAAQLTWGGTVGRLVPHVWKEI